MMQHVGQAGLDQLEVLPPVLFRERQAGDHFRPAAVHLQRAHRTHQHRAVRGQAAEPTLQIPELLEPDVRGKAALGDVIVGKLQRHPVGDNR